MDFKFMWSTPNVKQKNNFHPVLSNVTIIGSLLFQHLDTDNSLQKMKHFCLFLLCGSRCSKCQVLPKQPCLIMILFVILWISCNETMTHTHTDTQYILTFDPQSPVWSFFSSETRLHSEKWLVTWTERAVWLFTCYSWDWWRWLLGSLYFPVISWPQIFLFGEFCEVDGILICKSCLFINNSRAATN